MRVRSIVGLIPLFAVDTIEPAVMDRSARIPPPPGVVHAAPPGPVRQHRFPLASGVESRRLLSLMVRSRLTRVYRKVAR